MRKRCRTVAVRKESGGRRKRSVRVSAPSESGDRHFFPSPQAPQVPRSVYLFGMIAFMTVMVKRAGIQDVVESDGLGHIFMVRRGIFPIKGFSLSKSERRPTHTVADVTTSGRNGGIPRPPSVHTGTRTHRLTLHVSTFTSNLTATVCSTSGTASPHEGTRRDFAGTINNGDAIRMIVFRKERAHDRETRSDARRRGLRGSETRDGMCRMR